MNPAYFSVVIVVCGGRGREGKEGKRGTGLREGHSPHSSVCLTQQGGLQLCFLGDTTRQGEGMEKEGSGDVEGLINTDGKDGRENVMKKVNWGKKCNRHS